MTAKKKNRLPGNAKPRPKTKPRPRPTLKISPAKKLITAFTGAKITDIGRRAVNLAQHGTLVELGMLEGVVYTALENMQEKKFIHQFKKGARPTLAVSDDGLQLYILDGKYEVSYRGIVDTGE